MLWRLRTGASWRDETPRAVADRLRTVHRLGVGRDLGLVCWSRSRSETTPSTRSSGRYRSTPPARSRSPQKGAPTGDELEEPAPAQDGQALGRSRGGLTTKVHLACDGAACLWPSSSRPATSTTPQFSTQ